MDDVFFLNLTINTRVSPITMLHFHTEEFFFKVRCSLMSPEGGTVI